MLPISNKQYLQHINVGAKTILIKEGEITQKMFIIKKGIVRVWFNSNGKDLTTQFFLEGESATSLESFLYNEPSPFNIETIEYCEMEVLNKKDFNLLMSNDSAFKDWFYDTAIEKLLYHSKRLLSFIKNKPQDRYRELQELQPELLNRISQHYLASYLGVTTVSLSRIRNRK